jgi:HAD superfamily hydrolase (TIGR01509 family)
MINVREVDWLNVDQVHKRKLSDAARWNYDISAVIIDVDGTLLDVWPTYHRCCQLAAGCTIPYSWYMQNINPCMTPAAWASLNEEHHLELTREEFLLEQRRIRSIELPKVNLFPGASEVLMRLWRRGIKLGVATASNPRDHALKVSGHREILSVFGAEVTSEDVTVRKPDPECYEQAAKRLKVAPRNTLVIEDDPRALLAAKAAGFATCWFGVACKNAPFNATIRTWREFDFGRWTWASPASEPSSDVL